jgi:hypothetical protein
MRICAEEATHLTRHRWMLLAWAAILALVIGFCAMYGGRNCEVPKSGPFHRLLDGHKFVPSHSAKFACTEVR